MFLPLNLIIPSLVIHSNIKADNTKLVLLNANLLPTKSETLQAEVAFS